MNKCLSLKTIEGRPFTCKYEAYHGGFCDFEPVRHFGFVVEEPERQPTGSLPAEDQTGTIFVDAELITRRLQNQDEWQFTLYYSRNHAKWMRGTLDEIRARFPSSFAFGDPGAEFEKIHAEFSLTWTPAGYQFDFSSDQPNGTPDQPTQPKLF